MLINNTWIAQGEHVDCGQHKKCGVLHATQEMLSVACNIGEFIGSNVTWDTWQPWRLLEVSVTVICEHICSL